MNHKLPKLVVRAAGEGAWHSQHSHSAFKIFPGWIMALMIFAVLGLFTTNSQASAKHHPNLQPQIELVILAKPDDPYYLLAEEISGTEKAPLTPSLPEAMAYQPAFMIWVVSPNMLSDAVMIEFGQFMKHQSSSISVGIITGSTIEQARALWQRRTLVRGERFFSANAPNPSAHIDEGQLANHSSGQITRSSLSKQTFLAALRWADYLTFTGHGGSGYLKLEEGIEIRPADIPLLNPVVVSTGSCQTFRLWNENSISLRFADQGAAAYSGFVFSPNEGFLIGEFDGLPYRYTWQDFPIGHVIQVQNNGTLQGFATFPYQYLLGDPRIALQHEPPYQWIDEIHDGENKTITYREVPAGVIPIRIPDGAAYGFVEAVGITAAEEKDPFYNSRLQMANIQNDKFILVVHEGGDLTLKLRRNAPWDWQVGDPILDSFDDTLIYSPQTGGDIISVGFAILPLLWTGWQALKKRLNRGNIHLAFFVGILVVILQGGYALLRLDQVTITSKTVAFSPLSILAGFILGACGALVFFQARRWVGKIIAILIITFSSWSVIVFGLLVIFVFNKVFFIPNLGAALYNYSLGLLPVSSFLLTLFLAAVVLSIMQRIPVAIKTPLRNQSAESLESQQ